MQAYLGLMCGPGKHKKYQDPDSHEEKILFKNDYASDRQFLDYPKASTSGTICTWSNFSESE